MQFKRFGLMLAAATFAAGAFASYEDNMLIAFSTEGDTYADGSPVLPGEWYALCWSTDGNFDGITYDCKPLDSNDKIVRVGAFARELENGQVGCPLVVFQIKPDEAKANSLEDGKFCVYLLDTRNAKGDGVAAKAGDRIGPAEIHGATASTTAIVATSTGALGVAATVAAETASWEESAVVGEEVTEAKIEKIVPGNDEVEFTVSGLMAGVKYNIKAGSSPDPKTFNVWPLEAPLTIADESTFTVDPKNAKFFMIVREPLTK